MEKLYLKKNIHESVLEISLNRPEIHNAFNEILIEQLISEFNDLENDKTIRVVVLSGQGKSFCAGADLNWMKKMIQYSLEDNIADSKKLNHLFFTINNHSKPVIAKIHGSVLGGGTGLVAVSDFALCTNETVFGFTEVRLGLVPAVISPYVTDKIGQSNARAYFLSGSKFSAEKAKELGLVHKVVSENDLDKEIENQIREYLQSSPQAIANTKKLVSKLREKLEISSLHDLTCRTISEARISQDGQEGMTALLSKRKPNWISNV